VIAEVFDRNPAVCGWSGECFTILAPLGPDRVGTSNFFHNLTGEALQRVRISEVPKRWTADIIREQSADPIMAIVLGHDQSIPLLVTLE